MIKKIRHRLLAMLLSVALILPTFLVSAVAADTLPTELEAPSGLVMYDNGHRNSNLEFKLQSPDSVLEVYEKGIQNARYEEETWNMVSDYGNVYLQTLITQVDYKIDDGEWHYTSDWDTSTDASDIYTSVNSLVVSGNIASLSSYYNYGIGEELITLGCVTETTDGSSTYYRFDQDNHTIHIRARYYAQGYDNDTNQYVYLTSPWSATASFGQGNKVVSTAPVSLDAPTLGDIRNGTITSGMYPEVVFDVTPGANVLSTLMWAEQYDEVLTENYTYFIVETSCDSNFGQGSVIYQYRFSENYAAKPQIIYEDLYYDLWYEIEGGNGNVFNWDGETVYVRAKYRNERTVNGSDSEIESPYSNVVSIKGPEVKKFSVTITHGAYGFDTEGYYSESYQITEGKEYHSVDCSPLEGCYVQSVTVNDAVKYDKNDEATHELLEWNSSFTYFYFPENEEVADKNLTINITYGGTPTAKYGITTECGTGGYMHTNASYDSWDDDSLVVYHGTAPTITINPYNGFEIEKVLINGVENAQAKADGEYTFAPITDNNQSIKVTFKRVAWRVTSDAYHGTISTDYEGYNESDYVKIGDDITFTFAPGQDQSGNYYAIERVYIDGVLNEQAKTAGSYTFEKVQAEHSVYVYYSEDPVITHDVTASSGENGQISPEGVVHVREGYTQRFYFHPAEGYEVDKVLVDNVEIQNLATKEYYDIANVTAEHTIHVTFKRIPVQYRINVLVSGNNPSVHTVNPRGETPVWEGESFTVTYSPFVGYEIQKVLVDNVPVTADGAYTIASVNKNTTIEIFFNIKSYTVTFLDWDDTVLKTENVEHGSQAIPPANPTREHYVFVRWDVDYSNVTTNVRARAVYEPAEYEVTFVDWNGTVLKTETVTYGGNATAPATPEREGYNFVRWSVGFTNVSENLTIRAEYEKKTYEVKFVDSDGTVLSTQTVPHGEAATPPAAPSREGFTFVGWDQLGYNNVTTAMVITAQYVEGSITTYTVTARALGNSGTVTPLGVTTVQENGSLRLTFTPDSLSKIVKVVVDGTEIEVSNSYEFTNITANHTIDVYFAPTAVINLNTDNIQNGTVSGHYDLIDDQTVYVLDITPNEGYEVDTISINGNEVDFELVDGQYIIRDLSEDMNIAVTFKVISGGNGDSDGNGGGTGNDETGDSSTPPTSGGNTGTGEGIQSPQTGDNSMISLWIVLMLLSGLAFVVTLKKRTVDNHN